MGETINIAEIADRLSKDIFKAFLWTWHPRHNDNFACVNDSHVSPGGKPKTQHPCDVIYGYDDPYMGKHIYLHTDLKSYGAETLKPQKLRSAFKSLIQSVECAQQGADWRQKYGVVDSEIHEVRGFLFVHNHDGLYQASFRDVVDKMDIQSLPMMGGTALHFVGPQDIQRLYTIANDILRLKGLDELDAEYSFYYPDLVLHKRRADGWGQAATIETLAGPYIVIRHRESGSSSKGYLIYYNRDATRPEEFQYLIDYMSRYQMLEEGQRIRIRNVHPGASPEMKANFKMAAAKYSKAWGFDPDRESLLDNIEVERVTAVTSNYNPGDMGWRKE